MPGRYKKYGVKYGKTHCPRPGTMVEVDPVKDSNLPSRALVIRPSRRAGFVDVQYRFNTGPSLWEVSCDRLSKALEKRGSTARPRPYDSSRQALTGARRRRKRRR
jgi:hypothetical protein